MTKPTAPVPKGETPIEKKERLYPSGKLSRAARRNRRAKRKYLRSSSRKRRLGSGRRRGGKKGPVKGKVVEGKMVDSTNTTRSRRKRATGHGGRQK